MQPLPAEDQSAPLGYRVDATPPARARYCRAAGVGLIVLACGFGCWWGLLRSMEQRVGVNVPRERADIAGLPADARSITYRVGGAFDPVPAVYEFDTSEASFCNWAVAMGATLEEGPASVRRYDGSRADVAHGLAYRKQTGPDSGWQICYDRDAGRAYYASQSR